jgi:hypothetical protein
MTEQEKNGSGSRKFKYKLQCYDLETDSEIILTITKISSAVRLFSVVRFVPLHVTGHHSLLNILIVLYGSRSKIACKKE